MPGCKREAAEKTVQRKAEIWKQINSTISHLAMSKLTMARWTRFLDIRTSWCGRTRSISRTPSDAVSATPSRWGPSTRFTPLGRSRAPRRPAVPPLSRSPKTRSPWSSTRPGRPCTGACSPTPSARDSALVRLCPSAGPPLDGTGRPVASRQARKDRRHGSVEILRLAADDLHELFCGLLQFLCASRASPTRSTL